MWCRIISTCLAALAANAGQPAIAETMELQPRTEWKLRAYDDKCRISRDFGSGEDKVTLWIDKGGPGPSVNLSLLGRPLRHPFGTYIRLTFAPEEPVERAYITLKSSKGRPVIAMFGVQPVLTSPVKPGAFSQEEETDEAIDFVSGSLSDEPTPVDFSKRFDAIESLRLSGAVMEPFSLQLEGFAAMMVKLADCTNELSERLAGNAASSRGKGSPALPTGQAEWAQKIQANYPYHLLKQGEEGSVGVRLTINASGRASFCEVVAYSGPPSFNDTACMLLLRHARFKAAVNGDGEPVPAFYSTKVTYRLNR